jgi:alpha-glucosidase
VTLETLLTQTLAQWEGGLVHPDSAAVSADWWKTAVVYQVYLRSFYDANGDGLGDIEGLRSRLGYLSDLGVDAVWINPWYPSPQVDAGYDVSDYRDIAPEFGDLAGAEAFVKEAHEIGLRVLLDLVPNHTSDQHEWFRAALAGDAAARARYHFRPGSGPKGDEPPNDWHSTFGGPAWTRVDDGEWYLHLFAPGQPDLNWDNPEVHREFEDVLRFWFDRGVDGFRIDVAHGLVKADELPDFGVLLEGPAHAVEHPAWDQEGVHEVYRAWRRIADDYDPPRMFVAEAWVPSTERLARYLRDDELHAAFQFDFLRAPWRADWLREVVQECITAADAVGAPATWVLSNHDVVRHVTRYARSQPDHLVESMWDRGRWDEEAPDVARGTERARAAILLMLALPGSVFLYQGEELGLPEVEDLPADVRQDPTFHQSGQADLGRDGCRVPLPWTGDPPALGFSPPDASAQPWLPQPPEWEHLAVDVQQEDPESMLSLYRAALRLRHEHLASLEPLTWLTGPPGTVGFGRCGVECWVNAGPEPVPLPDGVFLLSSRPVQDTLPPDTAVWLRVPSGHPDTAERHHRPKEDRP